MRRPFPAFRDGAEVALAAWAAVQTFALLAARDRFSVLFSLDPVSLPWVVLLWVKDLGAAAIASAAFVALLRLTARSGGADETIAPRSGWKRRAAVVAIVSLVGVGGLLARWSLPLDLPPGLWCDVAYEAEDALDSPQDGPVWGGVPLRLDGRPSSTMVSNLYLDFCRRTLRLFGQGEAGLRAISALPGSFLPFAGAALAVLAFGARGGLVTLALLSFCRWPLISSYWTWTGAALTLLATLAAAAAAGSLRSRSLVLPALAGLFTGLSFHTHPASAGAAIGLGLFALPWLRTPDGRRRIAVAAVAAALAAAPFFASFLDHPSRLGGRPTDVSVFSATRRPGIPRSVPLRLLQNAVEYSGQFLFTTDPNPRHNPPGRASFIPVVGIATAVGGALALRRALAGSAADRLLLALAFGGLLPGILSNPSGAPNTTRSAAALVPLVVLASGPLASWGSALARLLRVRTPAVAALGLALLVALETSAVPLRWAADPLVVSYFGPEETALGRSLRRLAGVPVFVAPGAVRDPIVLEACAARPFPVEPLRRFPRPGATALRDAPPAGPFWFVARPEELSVLRSAGFLVARGTPGSNGTAGPLLAWVRPPRADGGAAFAPIATPAP